MANIAIGPSKRNFIFLVMPEEPPDVPIVAQSDHHCQHYCARWCYFSCNIRAYAEGINGL